MNAFDRVPTQHDDLAGLLGDIERIEAILAGWDETPRAVAQAYRHSIEALNGEALRRLVRALKGDAAALAAMKSAVSDEIVYAVLRRHDIVKPSLNERVENALNGVRPMLASHGGDVELIKIAPPSIDVRFTGSCDGCPASALTFHAGVKKAVQEACPEITEIRQVKGLGNGGEAGPRFISPFALGSEGAWLFAAVLDNIPEDGVRAIKLGGENLLLSRQGVAVTCFQNACAHMGLPLDEGEVENGVLACPHHDFQYDLASGECLTAPEVALQSHAVRVVGHRVEVRLSK
jgi:nitrite reductase/ring-hydroxylating ferredoxin subunit/Fe-S cluster biogenesis protein NfuA